MKKLVSVLMALLFLLSLCGTAAGEEELPGFSGLVIDAGADSMTVVNAYGTRLTFVTDDPYAVPPEIGSLIEVGYTGDLATVAVAKEYTVITPATVKSLSGTVSTVEIDKITVKPTKGSSVTVSLIGSTAVIGKADTYKAGDSVTVTYAECAQFLTSVNLALTIEITKVKQEKKTEEEDTTNKKLTGVVTYVDHSEIDIRTSKGKSWTFKINSRTKYPSKKSLEEGCTVTVTYDGYASAHPYAKKINVTKTKSETDRGKTYKKSGTVKFFEGMMIGLTNGFEADVAYAKHSGKGEREPGRKVTVYYYKQGGENYATKIKWK